MKLYAKIQDREAGYERVVLTQFKDANDEKVFIEEVEMHGETCFKVVIDEGYSYGTYYYPVNRYSITELCIY